MYCATDINASLLKKINIGEISIYELAMQIIQTQ